MRYPSDDRDGSGAVLARLLASIRERGYAITVVAPSDGTFHGRRVLDGIETVRFGYAWPHCLERLAQRPAGSSDSKAASLLGRLLVLPLAVSFVAVAVRELCNAEVVYASRLAAGIVAAVVNLLTRRPLVVSFRGDDGVLARHSKGWRMLARWVTGRASLMVPVSGELKGILQELGVPESKCHLPNLAADTDVFRPFRRNSEIAGDVRLLFVGPLIRRKGLQDLLDALSDPDLDKVRLTVVGDGPYTEVLREMADLHGLSDRIEWKGEVPQVDVARIMRSCDVLCLPSYMEGRPRVVNEAMASGLPVIAARTGGIPDMVREGETALLFDPGDVVGLRECIKTLADSADLREKMGHAGYDFFTGSAGNWDNLAKELDALFVRVGGEGW